MDEGKRIEFVDLTKGICIILVVMSHVGGPFEEMDKYNIISSFRMPLYFFISGIFFKSYEGLWGFFLRKLNKLIIPFIFFYLGAFLVKYAVAKLIPNAFQDPVEWTDLLVVFHRHDLIGFNPPIWFLLALFNCSILFYIVHKLRNKNLKLMFLVGILIGVLGFVLGKLRIELPLYIDVAMTALPFYLGGFWIRRYNFFLYPHRFDKLIPIFIAVAVILMFFIATKPGMRTNSYEGNILQFYAAGFAGIFVIMLIGKRFKKAPVISYLGRYSVITLGVHALILNVGGKMLGKFIHNEWAFSIILLLVTLVASLIATPIFLKIIPQFVAQKDFFSISNVQGIERKKAEKSHQEE
ncbi:acyltransferase [Bacteroides sp. OttesenSCG-928-N06]|nr:acyltransferase [Bacteroides sp. OttesenSCG-928-N06]